MLTYLLIYSLLGFIIIDSNNNTRCINCRDNTTTFSNNCRN